MISSPYLKTAVKAMRISSNIIMRHYRSPSRLKIINKAVKDKYDWVTTADIDAEKAIIQTIASRFPHHNIQAEESGFKNCGSDYCWYIDPLSSTQNFVHKLPHFGSVVGLAFKDEPIAGAVADPYYGEIFFAEKEEGAWYKGKRITVSPIRTLDRAVMVVSRGKSLRQGSRQRTRWDRLFLNLTAECETVRMIGSNGIHLSYLAMGRIDGFVNRTVDIHSIVGSVVIAREAGARITTLAGDKWNIHSPSVVISNGRIHHTLLKTIRRA